MFGQNLVYVFYCLILSQINALTESYDWNNQNKQSDFNCKDKVLGAYYPDSSQCKIFHVCVKVEKIGIQDFQFLCPNGTTFDQEQQVCNTNTKANCLQPIAFPTNKNQKEHNKNFLSDDEPVFSLQAAEDGNDDDILNTAQSGHFYGNALNNLITSYSTIGSGTNRKINHEKDVSLSKEKTTKVESISKPKNFRGHIKAKATADPYFLITNAYPTKDQGFTSKSSQEKTFRYRTESTTTEPAPPPLPPVRNQNFNSPITSSTSYLTVDKFNRRLGVASVEKRNDFIIKLPQPSSSEKPVTKYNDFQRNKESTYAQSTKEQYLTRQPSYELTTPVSETTTKASLPVRKSSYFTPEKNLSTPKPFSYAKSFLEKTTQSSDNEDDGAYRPEEYEKDLYKNKVKSKLLRQKESLQRKAEKEDKDDIFDLAQSENIAHSGRKAQQHKQFVEPDASYDYAYYDFGDEADSIVAELSKQKKI